MSLSQMIIIGIIVLVVIPPDKLPEVLRTVGRFINDFRRQTSGAWNEFKNDAAFKPNDTVKDLPTEVSTDLNHINNTTNVSPVDERKQS